MAAKSRTNRMVHTYIEGNTVRKLEPVRRNPVQEKQLGEMKIRQNREKAVRMNRACLVVLTLAIIATMAICVNYPKMQTQATATLRSIDAMEEDYSELVEKNDARELQLQSNIDLNYIYKVATEELGMVNAGKDQIRQYDRVESRYVRQNEDIPED